MTLRIVLIIRRIPLSFLSAGRLVNREGVPLPLYTNAIIPSEMQKYNNKMQRNGIDCIEEISWYEKCIEK